MSVDGSSLMSLVPIIGAAITLVVFCLIMYACIRNVDEGKTSAKQDDWWGDEESSAERQVGEPSS